MSNFEKYKEFCDEILKINNHIRYVGIINESYFVSKKRKGLKNLLTINETKESISNIISIWEFRKQLVAKLGNGKYSMAAYSKIIRISIPFDNEGIILVSVDPIESIHEIIFEILKFKEDNF